MEHEILAQKRTAYALGELDPAERAVIQADLAKSKAHRLEVEEIRALGAAITGALAAEKQPGMSEIQHLAIESTLQQLTDDHETTARMRLRRQRLAFWLPTSLAASALLASGITLMMLSQQQSVSPIESPTGQSGSLVTAEPVNAAAAQRSRINEVTREYNQVIRSQPPAKVPVVYGPHVDTLSPSDADSLHAFHPAALTPLSSFPLTVDISTVPFVQRYIQRGVLPPPQTVHVESMINAFTYDDVQLIETEKPVAVKTEISDCPWNAGHKLARVVIKARGDSRDEAAIVAEGVRVRVEFNPFRVASYRLIGYENRTAPQGDAPRDERADLKAGHTITALYEIVPVGTFGKTAPSELLKYQRPPQATYHAASSDELFTVMLLYRTQDTVNDQVVEVAGVDPGLRLADASSDFRFAAAVAQFGLVLLDSPTKGQSNLATVHALAQQSLGTDPTGDRLRFVRLIEQAQTITVN